MDRVLQNTPATISETWYQGDSIADPGTVIVTVRRDDGTQVSTGNAVPGTAPLPPEARVFPLTAADTALLDRLTVTWASTDAGTLTTTVEIAGDFLFTIAEAKALVPSASAAQIAQVRTRVEQALEDACGAFVPRYDHAVLSGRRPLLRLPRPFLRAIRWASTTAAGVTTLLTASELSLLSVTPAGFVTGYAWPIGYGNIHVGYEHGRDRPPEPVRAAALDYARFLLTQDTSIDSRAERLITEDGTLVFGTGTTGLPSVDRVVQQYRQLLAA